MSTIPFRQLDPSSPNSTPRQSNGFSSPFASNSSIGSSMNMLYSSRSARNSSFLSSSSSSEDDDIDALFGSSTTSTNGRSRSRRPPKPIVGTRTSFILGDKLGEGSYATVKEGIDETTLRIVAVKILDLRRLRHVRNGTEGLKREVSIHKRLKRHPNIIELIDVIKADRKPKMYIILEMATGCTVQHLLDNSKQQQLSIPESQVANFAYQTLFGLQYMHGRGIIHRDIKPANLMLNANGTLKISDFGVAEFLNKYEANDNVSRTAGSPAFQAPEIARGDHGYSGTKVDVWALGVTIYMLLSGGRIPFEGETLIGLFQTIGEGKYDMLTNVSSECQDVISKLLTTLWTERPSVDEMLKHPWIVRGAAQLSTKEKEEKKWIPIPKKEFGILDVVRQMYDDDNNNNNNSSQTNISRPSGFAASPPPMGAFHPLPTNSSPATGSSTDSKSSPPKDNARKDEQGCCVM